MTLGQQEGDFFLLSTHLSHAEHLRLYQRIRPSFNMNVVNNMKLVPVNGVGA